MITDLLPDLVVTLTDRLFFFFFVFLKTSETTSHQNTSAEALVEFRERSGFAFKNLAWMENLRFQLENVLMSRYIFLSFVATKMAAVSSPPSFSRSLLLNISVVCRNIQLFIVATGLKIFWFALVKM